MIRLHVRAARLSSIFMGPDRGQFHKCTLVFTATLLACALAVSALAQQPDVRPYETEEDLWEALREDEITYDEFLELIDAHRVGTDGMLIPQSDWEELPGSDAGYLTPPDSSQSLTTNDVPRQTRSAPVKWSLRSGYDAELSTPAGGDGYTVGQFAWNNWRGLVDWQHDGDQAQWRRRTLMWSNPDVNIQWGNVEPRWGRGLVVGRRSRVITSSELDGSLWQPIRSRFNGVWMTTDSARPVSGEFLLSDVRSDHLIDRVAGVQVSAGRDAWRVGVNALSGDIERRDTSATYMQRVVGTYARLGSRGREVLAEVAVADNGMNAKAAEAVWHLSRGQIHARAWWYSERFINPWGGGPSASDARSILLADIDEEYSSRMIGERGFDLSTRIAPTPTMIWRWEWMTHREAATDPLQHDWTVRLQWHRRRWSLVPFARGKSQQDEPDTYAFGAFGDWGNRHRQLNMRCELGRQHADADRFVRAGAGARWELNRHIRVTPAIRWVDPDLDTPADGYWYFYLTETIRPEAPFRIEAALVWQRYEDRDRGDHVELRLRLVAAQL
jgi:hypothetical protein